MKTKDNFLKEETPKNLGTLHASVCEWLNFSWWLYMLLITEAITIQPGICSLHTLSRADYGLTIERGSKVQNHAEEHHLHLDLPNGPALSHGAAQSQCASLGPNALSVKACAAGPVAMILLMMTLPVLAQSLLQHWALCTGRMVGSEESQGWPDQAQNKQSRMWN